MWEAPAPDLGKSLPQVEPACRRVGRKHRECQCDDVPLSCARFESFDDPSPDAASARGRQQRDVDDVPGLAGAMKQQPADRGLVSCDDQRDRVGVLRGIAGRLAAELLFDDLLEDRPGQACRHKLPAPDLAEEVPRERLVTGVGRPQSQIRIAWDKAERHADIAHAYELLKLGNIPAEAMQKIRAWVGCMLS
jgi:hypothetical protein